MSVADDALLRIVDDLREGIYPQGTMLPSLQDLAQHLNISVTNVRAALQRLEVHGVVDVRQGRGGGVTVVTLDHIIDVLCAVLEPVPESQLSALVEAWFLVERDVFLLAADRATPAAHERLAEALQQLYEVRTGPAAAFQEVTFRIHTVAATAARNQFLKRYYSTLMNLLGTTFAHRGNLDSLSAGRRTKVLKDYRELLVALSEGDHARIETVIQRRARLQRQLMSI